MKKVKFAFEDKDKLSGEEGMFTLATRLPQLNISDFIYLLDDSLRPTWEIRMKKYLQDFQQRNQPNSLFGVVDSLQRNPQAGDSLIIALNNPFLSHDVFEFKSISQGSDRERAKFELDNVKVVPNPYIVANSWEDWNPFSTGRGPRELHFTHLPPKCTIRIYSLSGQLVDIIEHNNPDMSNGTEIWDMQTKDQLEIAYGIYVYHIDAGDVGEKIGKFAVIK